jgi:Spy/CpxP family protein refolding chaperone
MAAGQRTPPSPDKQAAHMAKALGLSADQQSQLQPILADRDQKVQALMQNQSLSPRDRHVQMKGIAQDTDSKINAILTDDQKQKYEAMKENRREKMMARRQANQATQPGQAPPPPPPGGSNPAPPQ